MTSPDPSRAARQMAQTDRYFGLDSVPLGELRIADCGLPNEQAGEPDPPTQLPAAQQIPAPDPAAPPQPGDAMSKDDKAAALAQLEAEVTAWANGNWPKDGWTNVVFGEGDPNAELMFIGEGPGADEDAKGRPFVGRAGQLLDKQIAAMKLERQQVYIANIAKTRPPGNRVPTPDEATLWLPWLEKQIEIIAPKVIVSLGATSAKYLLEQPKLAITRMRGTWQTYRGIDLMPTFHPAYLLRQYTTENRQRVWSDLQQAMERLGLSAE